MDSLSSICFLSLLSILQINKVWCQESIGCFVPVQCVGSTSVGITFNNDPRSCLQFCQAIPDCNFFTHYNSSETCLAYSNCPETNGECTEEDCISGMLMCTYSRINMTNKLTNKHVFFSFQGERNCDVQNCGIPGQCIDIVVGVEQVSDENQCIVACQQNPLCEFWTYNSDGGVCGLFEDCKSLDTIGCPTCVSGERNCPTGMP